MKKIGIGILMLFFCGCGSSDRGGGSSSVTPTPSGTQVNLTSVKGVMLGTVTGSQISIPALSGTDSAGRLWSGSFSIVADGPTVFEGQNVTKAQSSITLQTAGIAPVSSVSTNYFNSSDGSPYKSVSSNGVSEIPTSTFVFPTSVKVGDSGSLGAFSSSDGTTSSSTWSCNPGVNGGSLFVVSSIIKTGSTVTSTEVDTYYLSANGTPTSLTVSATTSGVTVNLSGSIG